MGRGDLGDDERNALCASVPPEIAAVISTAMNAVAALQDVRPEPLSADAVRGLGLAWHRLSAQVESGRLAVLGAIDRREDVVPRARRGRAGASFGEHVLGQARARARRDAQDAALLDVHAGDLRRLGDAFRRGAVAAAHVEVAVRAHRLLGERTREALVGLAELAALAVELGPEGDPLHDLLSELGPASGSVRQIQVVDAVLAHHARRMSVPEFDVIARRIVDHLNPPSPSRSHDQRFLHMSSTFDGSWVGRFSCGAAQGAVLKAALTALAAPRPGMAVDADGVARVIPDDRDLGARQMDALIELVQAALGGGTSSEPAAGQSRPEAEAPASAGAGSAPRAGTAGDRPAADAPSPDAPSPDAPSPDPPSPDAPTASDGPASREAAWQPPPSEGEFTVTRRAGVLSGPFPHVELVLVVGLEHLAAARAACTERGSPLARTFASFRRTAAPPGLGHAAGHDRIDDATLELLACAATIRAAVVSPEGAPLSLGRGQRLASHAQRLALRARDGGCVVPGCRVPADGCQAHHVIWWENGGATDLENLALVCARHHIEIHQGTWAIEFREGVPWVRPPAWLDRARPLLRNVIHHGPPPPGHTERR